jgi:hypothetical protein
MTDLLERVRALNPVSSCAPPSIDDVWGKLEDDQPTIEDKTSVASSGRDAQRRAPLRVKRPNRPRARRRSGSSQIGMAIAIAVPVVVTTVALLTAGHPAVHRFTPATTGHGPLLSPPQRLADGTISCYFSTSGPVHPSGGSHPDVGPGSATGQSPTAYCRRWYGLNAHTGRNAAQLKFVVCQISPTNVAVYVADGRPGQCRELGHTALPPGYTAARHQLVSLGRHLVAVQHRNDCVPPAALAAEVRPVLARLGFANWQITLPSLHPDPHYAPPAGTGGTCGEVISNPPASAPQFIASRRQVFISTGPPAHIARFINTTSRPLYQRSYRHCFTATSIRTLVTHAFASSGMQPRFATTTSNGAQYQPSSQRLYNAGCVRFDTAIPADNNRYADVVLVAHTGTSLPGHWLYPKPSKFQP